MDEHGDWGPKRRYGFLNNFCPSLIQTLRANHDIKLITNGVSTKNLAWYISKYATKPQDLSTNTSALLAKTYAFPPNHNTRTPELSRLNKNLLQRCANTLSREQELSAPQVVSYLMGWGDRFISHHFETIHWYAVVTLLKKCYPVLSGTMYVPFHWLCPSLISHSFSSSHSSTDLPPGNSEEMGSSAEVCAVSLSHSYIGSRHWPQCDSVSVEIVEGHLLMKDQIREYMDRGDGLENWNYLDFFLGTYDGKPLKDHDSNRGRPGNVRVPYRENSNRAGRCRIIRSVGHDTMPYFPGPWFPKRDVEGADTLFHASMLALLKPWRSIRDLKMDDEHFQDAFHNFMLEASDETTNVVENIQFFHECADSARNHYASSSLPVDPHTFPENELAQDSDLPILDNQPISDIVLQLLTEDDVRKAVERPFSTRELMHADLAVDIGKECGLLQEWNLPISYQRPALPATPNDMVLFDTWQDRLKSVVRHDDFDEAFPSDESATTFDTDDIEMGAVPSIEQPNVFAMPPLPAVDVSLQLNEKQSMVYNIVTSHLRAHLRGDCPSQRLMIVHGPGGTGKTAMLNTIAKTFNDLGASHLLAKTALSGVAAGIIDGQTLHSWAGLPIKAPSTNKWVTHPSKCMAARRKKNMGLIQWLTIDEKSMLTAPLLAYLAQVTTVVRTGIFSVKPSIPFANINVILLGDFHQFPPVANSLNALYNPKPSDEIPKRGRGLYEQFDVVIRLSEQMRITDPLWDSILTRARTGECTAGDLAIIDSLVLGNENCSVPDFTVAPWNECVLVSPRNAVQSLWNEWMLNAHCSRNGQTCYSVDAVDKCHGHELSIPERLAIAHLKIKQTNSLPHKIEIAIGMKVMVLANIAPDAGLANGSRGIVTRIILDPRESEQYTAMTRQQLQYPPAAIIFRPHNASSIRLQGLADGTVPIFPQEIIYHRCPFRKTYTVSHYARVCFYRLQSAGANHGLCSHRSRKTTKWRSFRIRRIRRPLSWSWKKGHSLIAWL